MIDDATKESLQKAMQFMLEDHFEEMARGEGAIRATVERLLKERA